MDDWVIRFRMNAMHDACVAVQKEGRAERRAPEARWALGEIQGRGSVGGNDLARLGGGRRSTATKRGRELEGARPRVDATSGSDGPLSPVAGRPADPDTGRGTPEIDARRRCPSAQAPRRRPVPAPPAGAAWSRATPLSTFVRADREAYNRPMPMQPRRFFAVSTVAVVALCSLAASSGNPGAPPRYECTRIAVPESYNFAMRLADGQRKSPPVEKSPAFQQMLTTVELPAGFTPVGGGGESVVACRQLP